MSIIISWLVHSAAVFATAELLPGFTVKGFKGAMVAAAILGLLQALLGKLLFIVLGLGTLGLGFVLAIMTRLAVTTILLVLTDKLSASLDIKGWKTAFIGALAITALSNVAEFLLR